MSRTRARTPRIFICTATTTIAVHGTGPQGRGCVMTAGAQVDFDDVIGEGPDGPVTLEQALGVYAERFFRPATPAPAPMVAQDEE